jgi:hypothetical protein
LAPRLFEITLLRRDRVSSVGEFCQLPHPLDRPNLPALPDITFPLQWR